MSDTTGAGPAPRVAILVPCHNEAPTIGAVVRDFLATLPSAVVYVFDNNSTDATAEEAAHAGAVVRHVRRRGKGYVVQAMFREVDADVFVMVDGDGTYPASAAPALIAPVAAAEADMVVGSRLHARSSSEFHWLNRFGNRMYRWLVNTIFGVRLTDMLSGYRAFSRRLVRTLPLFGGGFETEIEMTIKALERGFTVVEVPVNLRSRPPGSHSKIRIAQDGFLIFGMVLRLLRDYKPLRYFAGIGLLLVGAALVPGLLVVRDYLQTGLVVRMSAALLSTGLFVTGMMFILVGLVLHSIARRFQEQDRQMQLLADELLRKPRQ